ncbi:MAG: hypothetical protein ACRD1K_02750 [Acidimicrobiales bacterium]
MGVTPWWEGIDAVTVIAPCAGGRHRVTWRRGRVVLEDHPHLEAERALAALGAPSLCLDVLSAWSDGGHDTRLVVYGLQGHDGAPPHEFPGLARAASRPLTAPPGMTAFQAAIQRATGARQERQGVLGRLPPSLARRWALGAVVHHSRRWDDLSAFERLDLELCVATLAREAVLDGARAWRRLGRLVVVDVQVALAGPGDRPWLRGALDHRSMEARVQVPLSWLVAVWARGRAVVDGCLVLEVHGDTAKVVRWERAGPGPVEAVTVPARLWRGGDGEWHLRW